MDTKYFKRLIEITEAYNGKSRICGDIDCNLMVLYVYEPEIFQSLHKKFDSIEKGVKLSMKLTGYKSVQDLLINSDRYQEIPPQFASTGDIGVNINAHCCFLFVGSKIFGAQEQPDGSVIFLGLNAKSNDNHKIFRRL